MKFGAHERPDGLDRFVGAEPERPVGGERIHENAKVPEAEGAVGEDGYGAVYPIEELSEANRA